MAETVNKVTPEGDAGNVPAENAAETTDTETTEATTDEAAKKNSRIDFPIADAMYTDDNGSVVKAANADGKLVAVPKPIKDGEGKIVYAGFDPRKHNGLKKDSFASIATFLRYQALVARLRAIALIKGAEEKERKATNIEKFGDEETRKKVQKVARMREQLATLTQQLKDDNVDISEL